MERSIVERGRARGLDDSVIRQAVLDFRASRQPAADEPRPTLGQNIASSLRERGREFGRIFRQTAQGEINPAETGIQTVGETAGAAFDVVGATVGAGIRAVAPDQLERAAQRKLEQFFATPVGSSALEAISQGVDSYLDWKAENPRAADNVEALVNVAELFPAVRGVSAARSGVTRTAEGITSRIIRQSVEDVANDIVSQPSLGQSAAQLAQSKVQEVTRGAQAIPGRIRASAEQAALRDEVLAGLPASGRTAVTEGVLLRDTNLVLGSSVSERRIFNEMVEQARDFELNRGDKDPALAVGTQLRERLELLDAERKARGSRLGEVASNLGKVSSTDALEAVVDRLRGVPGLRGVRIDVDDAGEVVLDFAGTVASSPLTEPLRKSLDRILSDVVRRDAFELHTLRQELFEVLGGKKRAAVELSGTEERAFEAIRAGLADVLDAASPDYKRLNREFAQVAEPAQRIRRFMSRVANADEDILDTKLSLLARRLTGNAQSRPELEQIFRNIDEVLDDIGKKPDVDLARVQSFYNALERYYDIVRDTSFAAQVNLGVERTASGAIGRLIQKAADAAGPSASSRKAAFEALLKSLTTE